MRKLSEQQRTFLEDACARYEQARGSEVYDYLARTRGVKVADAAAYYRLGYVAEPVDGHERFVGRMCIPYVTPAGVVDLRFRCIEDHDCKAAQCAKYLGMHDSKPTLFNVRSLKVQTHGIALTEGECFPGDAEVLTRRGWVKFEDYSGEDVAQYEPRTEAVSMVRPLARVEKAYSGDLVDISSRGYTSITTPGHRIPAFTKTNPDRFVEAGAGGPSTSIIPRGGFLNGPGIPLSDDAIRLLIAVSADGTVDERTSGAQYVRMSLKRPRKIERMRQLLAANSIEATDGVQASSPDMRSFCWAVPSDLVVFKDFPTEWLFRASSHQRQVILEELVLWDGNRVPGRTMTEYSSNRHHNALWVQTMCHLHGFSSSIINRRNAFGEWFKVTMLWDKKYTSWQGRLGKRVHYDGTVYCVTVPSGAILVRQNGHITVSGNCDALAVEQECHVPAVGYPGAATWKKNRYWRRIFPGYQVIYVVADGDDTGQQAAYEIMADLPNAKLVQMPNGMDATEFLQKEGPGAMLTKMGVTNE